MSDLIHNSYFDGGVQSIGFRRNGLRATVGVIAAGQFHFATEVAERLTVVSGLIRTQVSGQAWTSHPAGTSFEIGPNDNFDVEAVGGPAAYLCEFIGG